MQKISKIALILGIVAAIIIVGGLIGWLAGGSKAKHSVADNPTTVESRPLTETHPTATTTGNNSRPTQTTATIESKAGATFPAGVLTNWEEKVEEIIGSNVDDTNKAEQLLALFPHVPAESQSEVAQHLSNLVPDDNYAPLGALLKDPTLNSDTLDVLVQDVLGRPNSLKLPELLEVAQIPNHPKADEAKDFLSLFLEEDYGDDWTKWHDKMVAWLKDNPD